jgi:orotate phosphoribosyltransferase
MTPENVIERFKQTNAFLEGHFILSSGLHSPNYLQCALALKHPADAKMFGEAIAEHFKDSKIETVASPAIGGLIIGYEVARALNVNFIWTERQDGAMTLRRGFAVEQGEKILVVEDVVTTGGSTRETIEALEKYGANVVGAASIIDRSGGGADVGVSRVALATLTVPTYQPTDCPLCAKGIIAVKPGSGRQ